MVWIVAAVVLVGLAAWAISVFNRLVDNRNQVRNAWSQIDVQLKRRHDLIPNLVDTAKAYMQHERGIFENVARAREQAMAAGDDLSARIPAEAGLATAVRTFLGRVESYPELKASANMLALQEELSSTENRIGFARQFYNDSVMEYNTAISRFPTNFWASPLGFVPQQFFHAESVDQAVPVVRFSQAG